MADSSISFLHVSSSFQRWISFSSFFSFIDHEKLCFKILTYNLIIVKCINLKFWLIYMLLRYKTFTFPHIFSHAPSQRFQKGNTLLNSFLYINIPFLEIQIIEIIYYVLFYVGLLSHLFLRFIHIVQYVSILFLLRLLIRIPLHSYASFCSSVHY